MHLLQSTVMFATSALAAPAKIILRTLIMLAILTHSINSNNINDQNNIRNTACHSNNSCGNKAEIDSQTDTNSFQHFIAALADKRRLTTTLYSLSDASYASATRAVLTGGQNVISKPSNFNKISLHERQQRQQQEKSAYYEQYNKQQLLPKATQNERELAVAAANDAAVITVASHHTARNQPAATLLAANSANTFAVVYIAAATVKSNNSNNNIGDSHDSSSNRDNTLLSNGRYGLHDKINISNHRNEFNGRRHRAVNETTTTTAATTSTTTIADAMGDTTSQSAFSEYIATNGLQQVNDEDEEEEEVEQQRAQEEVDVTDERQQLLLLHRQKRYLLFPESSSFQMIFDLIIPIVDWTNFAIMGITCAVAWELPSKPPSEIIENFQDKLNDGTFGLTRRNDTTQGTAEIKYVDNQNSSKLPATVATANDDETVDVATVSQQAKASWRQFAPQATVPLDNYYYQKHNNNKNNHNSPPQFHETLTAGSKVESSSYVPWSRQQQQTTNYYDNNHYHWTNTHAGAVTAGRAPITYATNPFAKFYSTNTHRNGGAVGTYAEHKSGYASAKRKYGAADEQRTAAGGWRAHSKAAYQRQQSKKQWQPSTNTSQRRPDDWNWWQRNAARLQGKWQMQQRHWTKYDNNVATDKPDTTYQTKPTAKNYYYHPSDATNGAHSTASNNARTGRMRQLLQQPPQHHIYPVFAKRRRRRNTTLTHRWRRSSRGGRGGRDWSTFELKLQQIHLREHLRTRHKLYGKIEKLFKV